MSNILEVLPPKRGGGDACYDWKQWLDGRVHELVEGEDCVVSRESMRAQAFNAAKKQGLILQSRSTELGRAIQAMPPVW